MRLKLHHPRDLEIYLKEFIMYGFVRCHADEDGLMSDLLEWTRMIVIRMDSKQDKEQKSSHLECKSEI